ncbi:MAG: hypothetical protein HRU20_04535 [Pseudomonadales bacterium]|nr:hypothetical protein [Pseudomonadales bacterium]
MRLLMVVITAAVISACIEQDVPSSKKIELHDTDQQTWNKASWDEMIWK